MVINEAEQVCNIGIDYLRCTFKTTPVEDILQWFQKFGLAPKRPFNGYTQAIGIDGEEVTVMFDGAAPDMGVNLEIKGSGLAFLERNGFPIDRLLANIKFFNGRPSRIDIAFDCHNYGRSAAWYRDLDNQGKLVTRSRVREWHEKKYEDGRVAGTLCLGSRQSPAFVRIYDKGIQKQCGDVTRIEIECKDQNAPVVFQMMYAGKIDDVKAYLRSIVQPKTDPPRGVKKAHQLPDDPVWVQMLGEAKKGLLITIDYQKLISDVVGWVSYQTATSFAMLSEAGIDVSEMVRGLARQGRHQLREKHKRVLATWKSGDCSLNASLAGVS